MNREELFQLLSDIDEDLLVRCEHDADETGRTTQHMPETPGRKHTFWQPAWWIRTAACLALVLAAGTGVFLSRQDPEWQTTKVTGDEPGAVTTAAGIKGSGSAPALTRKPDETDTEPSYYADINSLLTPTDDSAGYEEFLKLATVPLPGGKAVYESISCEPSKQPQLKEAAGTVLSGNREWYLLAGHEDMQYLIRKEEKESYSLWEFKSFQSTPDSYRYVLEEIYKIRSADDIAKIVVSPATIDNTDAGKALQEEIGTITVDDPEELATIYEILASLTYSDEWIDPSSGNDTPQGMLYAVQMGRYLTIVTRQGNRHINRLKYNGIMGNFYEYGGICYQSLEKKKATELEQILKVR